jgi:hypothetical protein
VCSARRDARVLSSSLAAPPRVTSTEGSEEDEEGEETVFQMIDGKERRGDRGVGAEA